MIERMRRAGRGGGRGARARSAPRSRPASPPTSSTRICHEACIARGRLPEPAQLRRLPEVGVHVGERGHLPRHPRRPGRCATATSSTSTSRSSSTACTATRTPRSSSATVDDRVRAPRRRRPASASQRAIAAVRPGGRSRDIGRAIQDARRGRNGFGVVRAFVGHGIGDEFHTDLADPALLRAARRHGHRAGHDLHDRADDHAGLVAAPASGTTTGPRSPSTVAARRSSSTRSSVTDDGADVLTLHPDGAWSGELTSGPF